MPPKIVSKDNTYVPPLEQIHQKPLANPAKRIRVSRACDTCRKRKVKCDGKHPCIHCTVYSYECTYNQVKPLVPPQKKKPKTDDKKKEDKRLQLRLMREMFPEVGIEDSSQCEAFARIFAKHRTAGQVDMKAVVDEYNGQMHKETLDSLNAVNNAATDAANLGAGVSESSGDKSADSHKSSAPRNDHLEIKIILPPREIALKLIYKTWSESCVLFRFYHRPSFINDFNSLYETAPAEYSHHQNKMLPLIYSVISVGALFSKGDNAIDNQYLQDEGYKYFIAARKLIDITNTTDIESVQTIFMLTLFLQCSARLTTCYSYIGIALRSALRQGLHKQVESTSQLDNITQECRKRLFWTIYKMEIYVNSVLGLPHSIDEDDITVEFPLDVDDVNIEVDHIAPQPEGKLSSCGINNCHTKLILILNHIVKKLYKTSKPIYMIPKEVFQSLENELRLWKYELPYQLQPDSLQNIPPVYMLANRLLYLDYLHVQLMLYRPYIHYVKLAKQNGATRGSFKSFEYDNGMHCVGIAKKIIMLAQTMIRNKMLNGSYWFSIYTIFFCVACLVYYFLEIDNHDEEIKVAIEIGKEMLSVLKERSMSAERIFNLLNHMFENYERHNIKFQELQQHNREATTPRPSKGLRKTSSGTLLNRVVSPNANANATTAKADNTNREEPFFELDGDFNIDIFSKFLPGYLLETPGKLDNLEMMAHSGNYENSPLGTVSTASKNDEREFDWERFIDKDDVFALDV